MTDACLCWPDYLALPFLNGPCCPYTLEVAYGFVNVVMIFVMMIVVVATMVMISHN